MSPAIRSTRTTTVIEDAIRQGIVNIARRVATVGATIHVPAPGWRVVDGGEGLTPLTVANVEATHVQHTSVVDGATGRTLAKNYLISVGPDCDPHRDIVAFTVDLTRNQPHETKEEISMAQEIRTMPDGRRIFSDTTIMGYYTTSEFYPTLGENIDLSLLPYSIIVDGIEWRSASPMRVGSPEPPLKATREFLFFPLWEEINVGYPMTLRGTSPVDALLRHWATCLPGSRLSSPFRCLTDGHIYQTALTERGREIHIVAEPIQGTVNTVI
jgi:hypothetical protein